MFYHIRIKYISDGKTHHAYGVNFTKTETDEIAKKFENGDSFWFDGRRIIPKRVDVLKIFSSTFNCRRSSEYWHQMYPDGYWGHFNNGIEVTNQFIKSPPSLLQEETETKASKLFTHISFLQLDDNWINATIALQLQEVAVTILSKRFGIILDKKNVEEVLGKKIKGELNFKVRYDAFSKKIEKFCKVKMPLMTKDLRGMRTQVLHRGYNPKKEETDAIISFTTGFLQKLESLKPQSM